MKDISESKNTLWNNNPKFKIKFKTSVPEVISDLVIHFETSILIFFLKCVFWNVFMDLKTSFEILNLEYIFYTFQIE